MLGNRPIKLFSSVLLLFLFGSNGAFAGDPMACDSSPKWALWAEKCKLVSEEYRESGMPNTLVNATCSDPYYLTKTENTRCRHNKPSFDQLYALVAEAFYAKRKDHRDQALRTLMYYECESEQNCEIFRELVDVHLKKNILIWSRVYSDLLELAMQVKEIADKPRQK